MMAPAEPSPAAPWPVLPSVAAWKETYTALHMRTQLVGKTRLALSPLENHWWQVALYLTPSGLTTGAMYDGPRAVAVDFDFRRHRLVIRADDARRELALRPQSVAEFHAEYTAALRDLGLRVSLWPVPVELPEAIPFPDQVEPAPYDADTVERAWLAMAQADRVLRQFRGGFLGKCSPVHFWWGSFDLACTRFSGARAPRHPGGIPHLADWVTREAYSHACISAGWWPGTPGGIEEPSFYAYAYPEPVGCPDAGVRPAAARYDLALHEWVLPYEAVRTAPDPDAALLDFLHSTYEAAATLGGWDRQSLERHGDPRDA